MSKRCFKECKCKEIQTLPPQITVCEGTPVELTAIKGIWPEPCVQWQVKRKNGSWDNIPRKNSPRLSFIANQTQNGNTYQAVIKTKCECLITNVARLTVNFIELFQNPTSRCFVAGEIATFTAVANGNPEPDVQWQVSTDDGLTWINIPGANSSTLTFEMVEGQEGNLYRAVFSNSCGTITTTPAILFEYQEDFNLNNGGFTVANTGTFISDNPGGPWTYDSINGRWFVNGSITVASSTLKSPLIRVPSNTIFLQFNHAYNFEEYFSNPSLAYDGGNIKISVNGGPPVLVPLSSFTLNGYNRTVGVLGNPLSGQPVWSAISPGWPNSMITSVATLGSFSAGDVIQVEFVGGWDNSVVKNAPNWIIDSLTISCNNPTPSIQGFMAPLISQSSSLSLSEVDAIIQQLDTSIVNEQNPELLHAIEMKRQDYVNLRASMEP